MADTTQAQRSVADLLPNRDITNLDEIEKPKLRFPPLPIRPGGLSEARNARTPIQRGGKSSGPMRGRIPGRGSGRTVPIPLRAALPPSQRSSGTGLFPTLPRPSSPQKQRPASPPKETRPPSPPQPPQPQPIPRPLPTPSTPLATATLQLISLARPIRLAHSQNLPPDFLPITKKLHSVLHGLHPPLISAALLSQTQLPRTLTLLLPLLPPSLRVDIHLALARWSRGIFSPRPDEQYPTPPGGKVASRGGAMGFIPGEVFVDMDACYRAGMHNRPSYGIAGKADYGAYSVVTFGGGEDEDRDGGELLEYTGTRMGEGGEGETYSTALLKVSARTGNPVRVLRGARGGWSAWAPEWGVRYDGLYTVEGWEGIVEGGRVRNCRFRLRRCADEEQVGGVGLEAIRHRPGNVKVLREALGRGFSGGKWVGEE